MNLPDSFPTMIKIGYRPAFVRRWKKLPLSLQTEARDKIELFKDSSNHKRLGVHKLHGRLKKYYSFSLNYEVRIIFEFQNKESVVFLDIDNHDVYQG